MKKEKLNLNNEDEIRSLMILSQESMKELWDNEYDEVWNDL